MDHLQDTTTGNYAYQQSYSNGRAEQMEMESSTSSTGIPGHGELHLVAQRLLAENNALKARCLTLENTIFALDFNNTFTPTHIAGPLNFDTQYTHPAVNNDGDNGYQASNGSIYQTLDTTVVVPTTATHINTDTIRTFLDPTPNGTHIDIMTQTTINEGLDGIFDLDTPIVPSSQSYDAGPPNPPVQTSFALSQIDNTYANGAGFGSGANTVPTPRSMHHCQHCMRVFSRAGDLRRHALSHNPNAPRLICPRPGCGRQFLRMDKLRDHRARKNH